MLSDFYNEARYIQAMNRAYKDQEYIKSEYPVKEEEQDEKN